MSIQGKRYGRPSTCKRGTTTLNLNFAEGFLRLQSALKIAHTQNATLEQKPYPSPNGTIMALKTVKCTHTNTQQRHAQHIRVSAETSTINTHTHKKNNNPKTRKKQSETSNSHKPQQRSCPEQPERLILRG